MNEFNNDYRTREEHLRGFRGKGRKRLIWMIPLGLAGAAAFFLLGALFLMLLWNRLMPAIFALPVITWGQALGLLVLARLLLGGFHHSGHSGPMGRAWSSGRRKLYRERWQSMRDGEGANGGTTSPEGEERQNPLS